jgi:signal transduction histidine kinase
MANSPHDDRWPKVLSLAAHEFRTPTTVVAGYIRMLLKDRAGAVTDSQRRLLEEAEKSCARLSALLAELSDLSSLEAGTATFNRRPIDFRAALKESVSALPDLPERHVDVDLQLERGEAHVDGDPVRLRAAFSAILIALRRELVTSSILAVRETVAQNDGGAVSRLTIADPDQLPQVMGADEAALTMFDEWRGGCGLSLPVARRILEAHGGRIWSPAMDAKAGAVIALPHC